MTNNIRKQVYDLAPDDLALAEVWEFALDEEDREGQDEATVRPYDLDGPLDPAEGMFVVKARFVLSDGTVLAGYLTPAEEGAGSLADVQPVIATDTGQVGFWYGVIEPSRDHIAANYIRLGKSSAGEVFPVHFESAVALTSGPVRGQIPGFLVLEDFSSGRTRVVM